MSDVLDPSTFSAPAPLAGEVGEMRTATVLGPRGEAAWRVVCGVEHLDATLAASCLLQPGRGDVVLVARIEDGRAFVLAVLSRAASQADLAVPGAPAVRIAAPALALAADALSAEAGTMAVRADRANVTARVAQAVAVRAALTAQQAEVTAETLLQKAGTVIRRIRGLDSSTSQAKVETVETTMVVRTKNGSITAERHLRLDADQICAG